MHSCCLQVLAEVYASQELPVSAEVLVSLMLHRVVDPRQEVGGRGGAVLPHLRPAVPLASLPALTVHVKCAVCMPLEAREALGAWEEYIGDPACCQRTAQPNSMGQAAATSRAVMPLLPSCLPVCAGARCSTGAAIGVVQAPMGP